jgi:hypothetical protein
MTSEATDARDIEVRWTAPEVAAIQTAALRGLEAERQAAVRFQVMEAHAEDVGDGAYPVVDHHDQVVVRNHPDPHSARLDADQLVADEAERLVSEWEAER